MLANAPMFPGQLAPHEAGDGPLAPHKPAEHHRKAAEHSNEAAKAHERAARHYAEGRQGEAAEAAHQAHGHESLALDYSRVAARSYATHDSSKK